MERLRKPVYIFGEFFEGALPHQAQVPKVDNLMNSMSGCHPIILSVPPTVSKMLRVISMKINHGCISESHILYQIVNRLTPCTIVCYTQSLLTSLGDGNEN